MNITPSPQKTRAQRAVGASLAWIVIHPAASILLSLVLMGALALGLPRLNFSNDISVFFSPDNPDLKAFQAMEATYAKGASVLMVVSTRDENASLFTRENLAALQDITARAWKTPYSRRADSLTNFQYSYAEGDNLTVRDLVADDPIAMSDEAVAEVKSIALREPLLLNRLLAPDGKVTGINIPVSLPGKNPLKEQPEVADFVRALAKDAEQKYPGLRVQLTGIVMINQELADEAAHDFTTLVPIMFLFIIGTLGLLLRSVGGAACAFVVILIGNIAALGAAGFAGVELSPPVISSVNMIMVLAIAGSVHVLDSFRRAHRPGTTRAQAMRTSLEQNFKMIFFTSLTTVVGFASLNTSESPPFRELGNVVAFGVIFVWIFLHTVLAPMMVLLPGKPDPKAAGADDETHAPAMFRRLMELVTTYPARILVASSLLTLAIGSGIWRNELNDEFVKYFDSTSKFRQATDFTIARLTGFEYIEYSIDSGSPGGIADPDYLRKLDEFAKWFRTQPKVRSVYSHTDIIKRLHQNLHGDAADAYAIPKDRGVATDCLTVYEMSLPFGLDLTDRINLDKSATLFRASLSSITSNEMIDLDKRATQWLRDHQLSPGSTGTGQSLMFARIGLRNISSQLWGTILSTVLISACMIFVTRSFKYAAASLLPNLVPAGIGFGIWGFAVGQVGLATSIVVGMTLGIVVDDTVHFVMQFLRAHRDEGRSPADAVKHTLLHCGWPMVTSNIALVLGFSVLGFSSFELNRSMGILSALIIAIAMIFDLVFTPALLLLLANAKLRRIARKSGG